MCAYRRILHVLNPYTEHINKERGTTLNRTEKRSRHNHQKKKLEYLEHMRHREYWQTAGENSAKRHC